MGPGGSFASVGKRSMSWVSDVWIVPPGNVKGSGQPRPGLGGTPSPSFIYGRIGDHEGTFFFSYQEGGESSYSYGAPQK